MGPVFRCLPVAKAALAVGLVAALALLVAACGEPSEAETLGEELEGRTWRSQDVLIEGGFDRELFPLVRGTQIVATFEDGRLRVHTGCEIKLGSVTIRTAGAVTVTDLQQSAAPCDEAMDEQDRLVTDLLLEGPTVTVEDDFMTWTGRSLVVEFIDEESVDAEPG